MATLAEIDKYRGYENDCEENGLSLENIHASMTSMTSMTSIIYFGLLILLCEGKRALL